MKGQVNKLALTKEFNFQILKHEEIEINVYVFKNCKYHKAKKAFLWMVYSRTSDEIKF